LLRVLAKWKAKTECIPLCVQESSFTHKVTNGEINSINSDARRSGTDQYSGSSGDQGGRKARGGPEDSPLLVEMKENRSGPKIGQDRLGCRKNFSIFQTKI
jgi:hypothetical protein